jgi:pre-rRNA-processing protein TSR2
MSALNGSARSSAGTNAPTAGLLPSSVSSPAATKIDLLISLHLHSWPALTLAIQNHWGGPKSNDKRDWLAGAVSDLLTNGEVTDPDDLEEVLVQVMLDEFEVVVDDDTPAELAASIMKGRQRILQGDYSEVDQMLARWEEKRLKGPEKLAFKKVEKEDDDQDTDWESNEEDEEDVEMDEAPQLVPALRREKQQPEVDEDGFTKVAGKKKR